MIAYLKGTILQKHPNQVIIDCHGVGYCASIPLSTYFKLGELGDPVELFIHTHLTDDSLALFGFSTRDEREVFLKLISISGIGPKLAMNVLSGMESADLVEAVKAGDVARIAMVPGIGKKTALRIAMELQDKIEKKEKLIAGRRSQETEDLVSALMNMGFRRKEVERVVDETIRADKDADLEKRLRECLKKLAKV
jgi:Holliday junction DNA helicase RuvA